MYYSIDMNFFYSKDNLVALHFKYDQARRRFVEWAQNEIAVVPDFHKRILFSDEAHFCLNGYVNKQNCRIWSEANPQVYVETPLHPEKLTVWCALWAGGIIGPYFFKNDEGHNVTVNGDRYRALITNVFIPELNNQDVQELWFQQDGATCHTARATIDLLKNTFGDRLISRFGPVNWPPRSCDFNTARLFYVGYVKSLVYADKPQTLDHLEDNIRRVIADIRPQMLEKVIENWTSRLDYIRTSRGSPMPEIIFKIVFIEREARGLNELKFVKPDIKKGNVKPLNSFNKSNVNTTVVKCNQVKSGVKPDVAKVSPSADTQANSVVTVSNNCTQSAEGHVLLSTALINVKSKHGEQITCRALIDNASQNSLISKQCADRLKLPLKHTNHKLVGVNETFAETSLYSTNFEFSCVSSDKFQVKALLVSKVTSAMPNFPIKYHEWPHIKDLTLADPPNVLY
ncbi:transposase [Trichonephila clavipes]|nr:transposase [Trichonephila clavipes]